MALTKKEIQALLTASTPDLSFEVKTYSGTTIAVTYNPLRPNFKIVLTGNLTINLSGTADGQSGIMYIKRAAGGGSETLIMGLGTGYGSNTFPTGAGADIFITYWNAGGTLFFNLIK